MPKRKTDSAAAPERLLIVEVNPGTLEKFEIQQICRMVQVPPTIPVEQATGTGAAIKLLQGNGARTTVVIKGGIAPERAVIANALAPILETNGGIIRLQMP